MPLNRLGNYVRERRMDLGLTQEELAFRIGGGATQAEVSRIERGMIAFPRRRRLESLAEALGVTLGALLMHSGWLTSEESALVTAPPPPPPPAPPQSDPAATESILAEMNHLRETLFTAIERIGRLDAMVKTAGNPHQQPAVNVSTGVFNDVGVSRGRGLTEVGAEE